jgi:uncharacterized protein (DUF1501 family)
MRIHGEAVMFSLFDGSSSRQSRRSFLRVGALGLGGLALPDLLRMRSAAAAAESPRLLRDRSVILLFLHGGPSQIETFDPKMTAPAEYRSITGEIRTALPGVTFGGSFPKLARLADKLAVVRSFTTGNGNHDIKPVVCADTLGANMGSLYARVAGTNRPGSGMPTNAAVFPQSVDPAAQPATSSFGRFESTGKLGSIYAPFVPGGGGQLQKDMRLNVPMDRLSDRRNLLSEMDRIRWAAERGGALDGADRFREQAFDVILGGISDAFDLSKENPRVVERYDTAPLVRVESISKKWNNHKNYADNARTLGKLLLLARRLCEAGCGFVTVTTNFVWDMHADANNATIEEGMSYMAPPLDHAVSAFVEDVESRGLSDKIMLVACGEMGRTPKINKKAGRDHWGNLAPLLLYGGGLRTGQVVGRSDRIAGEPADEPYTNRHLIATVLHTLVDPAELRLVPGLPNELANDLPAWEPIREVMA